MISLSEMAEESQWDMPWTDALSLDTRHLVRSHMTLATRLAMRRTCRLNRHEDPYLPLTPHMPKSFQAMLRGHWEGRRFTQPQHDAMDAYRRIMRDLATARMLHALYDGTLFNGRVEWWWPPDSRRHALGDRKSVV